MCRIESAYFTKNGTVLKIPGCTATSSDKINVESVVTFSGAEIGGQYKCELKISGPGLPSFSFFTPLRVVTSVETFTSQDFTNPVPTGLYTCTFIVIYDSAGNTICTLSPVSVNTGEPCNTVNITAIPATVNVSVLGNGRVKVSKNNVLIGETSTNRVFDFTIGDTFKFEAVPDSGNTFDKFCTDAACSVSTKQNPFVGIITQSTGTLFCHFIQVTAVGSINFVSTPPGAEIFIDSSDQQHITPFTITNVPVGTHSYRLTLANFPDITGNVTVQVNTIAQVSVNFTTGQVNVGLVVLGLGVTAVLIGGIYYLVLREPDTIRPGG